MRAGSAELRFSGGGHVDVVKGRGAALSSVVRTIVITKYFFQALKIRYAFIYLTIMGTAVENHFGNGVMAGLKRGWQR